MTRSSLVLAVGCIVPLAGCAQQPSQAIVDPASVPAKEPLYSPERVKPGRLEYAPDRSTFAPVLTERFVYPTQAQANAAYRRLLAYAPADRRSPSSVRLFGCKPGALDADTARVTRYRGPVVHCATDILDAAGRPLGRQVANFYYWDSAWRMQPVDPPRSAVSWRNRESSPKDFWWWAPGRDRYE